MVKVSVVAIGLPFFICKFLKNMSKLVITPLEIIVPFWNVFKMFLPYIVAVVLIRIAFVFLVKKIKERKNKN